MKIRKCLSGLIMPVILAVLLAGCGGKPEEVMNNSATNEGNTESTEKKQITWALPLDYYELTDLDEDVLYLNKLLAEEGFAYELSFLPLEPEDYEAIISSGRTEGIDILSLGMGDGEGTMGYPQRLLQAGVLYDLSAYLHSPEGSALYGAFYGKLWDSLTIDGKNCVIPNQYGQDGTVYAAFRRDIFGDDVQWDGTVEGLFCLAEQAEIPEDMASILWGVSLLDISAALGYEYGNGFFVSLEDGSCCFPYQEAKLQETYALINEWYLSGRLQRRPNDNKTILEKNYAIWLDWQWLESREAVADEYVFVQLPFTFRPRVNGGIGICAASDNKEAALELLTLLFTREQYANALIRGEPGVKYEMRDDFVEYLNPEEQGSGFVASVITGIFDLVYPRETDDFPIDRKDTKWSLYGTEAERESPTAGRLPDLSDIEEELTALAALAAEYEELWLEEDMAAAWEEVNRRYEELDGDRIAAGLEELLKSEN